MNGPFTYEESSLLIRLFIAHLITDFLLQTKKGIANKKGKLLKGKAFWLHGLYTGLFAGVLMWHQLNWPVLLLITSSHLFIDYLKLVLNEKISVTRWPQRDLGLFVIDQLLHLLILILGWLIIINGFDRIGTLINLVLPNYQILLKVLGYLIVVGPATYLIKYLTAKWAEDVTENSNGLQDAGKWIGMLERLIVITLVFIQQYTAIGFLVTAKSILRLIDKPESILAGQPQRSFSPRKHTEYVLIGTFLSFGLAMLTGLCINWLSK